MRDPAALPPALRPLLTCPTCGKGSYASRKRARRAARILHPRSVLRAYQCGPYWHYGPTPAWRVRGEHQ